MMIDTKNSLSLFHFGEKWFKVTVKCENQQKFFITRNFLWLIFKLHNNVLGLGWDEYLGW